MSLRSRFTRNNLTKYWNLDLNGINTNKKEIREEKHIKPIIDDCVIDDYDSSFLNTLEN